jgi:hypothetical protein
VSLELLAAISAASTIAVASLSVCEARLRAVASGHDDDGRSLSPHHHGSDDLLCIVSGRAQCACGHARNAHRGYSGDACGCNRFEYVGGLVSAPADDGM